MSTVNEPEYDSDFILYLEKINNKYGFEIKEKLRIEIKKLQDLKDKLLEDHKVLLKASYKMDKELEAYKNAYRVARNYLVQSRDSGEAVDTYMVARPHEIVEKYEY